LYHCQVAWLANQGQNYLVSGKPPGRLGTAHPNIVPYQSFRTSDGNIMVAVGNDRQFADCMVCLGCEDIARDSRFSRNAGRVEHREELITRMVAAFLPKTSDEWLEILSKASIPAGRVNDIAEVLSNELSIEMGLVRSLPHSLTPEVPSVTNPVHFSATPVEYRKAAPLLGEHTEEILMQRIGYSKKQVENLRKQGAV
jgi:formyl-CoA transferase